MNIAFTTILVLVILFPGFFFQSAYHSGPFSRKYSRTSVFNNIAGAVLPALLYHFFAIQLINNSDRFPYAVSFEAIGLLLLSNKDVDRITTVFNENIGAAFPSIITYIVVSVVIGAACGFLLAWLVRRYRLDLRWEFLRFDNSWHYLMIGEMRGWYGPTARARQQIITGNFDVRAQILVNVSGDAYVYSGIIHQYFLNKDGLGRIHLRECFRTPFPSTKTEQASFSNQQQESPNRIKLGDDIVIFRDTIINIDIIYQRHDEILLGKPAEVKEKFLREKGHVGLLGDGEETDLSS